MVHELRRQSGTLAEMRSAVDQARSTQLKKQPLGVAFLIDGLVEIEPNWVVRAVGRLLQMRASACINELSGNPL